MTDDRVPDRYTALDAEGYKTTELSVISPKSPGPGGRHVVAHCISKDFAERLANLLNAPPQAIRIAAREVTNTGTIGSQPVSMWIPVAGAPTREDWEHHPEPVRAMRLTLLDLRSGLRVAINYEDWNDPEDAATFQIAIDRPGDKADKTPWLTPSAAMHVLRRLGIRRDDLHVLDEALVGDRSKFDLLDLP